MLNSGALVSHVVARGEYLQGIRLQPKDQAKTIRVRGGKVHVSDGPFVETKEWNAEVAIIDCEAEENAIAQALKYNLAYKGRLAIRPIHSMGGAED